MALADIRQPSDLRPLSLTQLEDLAAEIREFVVSAVSETGGHLGSNLGAVELTLALHRVFDSPRDAILWDTGHQAYIHKLVTGRRAGFSKLRQADGISGYPSREATPAPCSVTHTDSPLRATQDKLSIAATSLLSLAMGP